MAVTEPESTGRLRDRTRHSMTVYMTLLYPVFLTTTLLGRMLPGQSHKPSATAQRLSIFAEAAHKTHSVVPWFFVHG